MSWLRCLTQSVFRRRHPSKGASLLFALGVLLPVAMAGCKDLTGDQGLPAGIHDPAYYHTPAGALGARNAADSTFEGALLKYVVESGLLTDELEDANTSAGAVTVSGSDPLDARILPQRLQQLYVMNSGADSYGLLQQVRGAASFAIGMLASYDSAASPALRGEMYALQGYAEVMLADLFCSGVPLSTLDFDGDFTYHAGSTTQAVYQDAVAKFDTALALSGDSARIMNLARVGLGRAYLALGQYTEADQAVAAVPDDFRYQFDIHWQHQTSTTNLLNFVATVSDREGVNGLPFLSSSDPRTRDTASVKTTSRVQLYFPQKYSTALTSPFYSSITVADGIEARLIRAEAALHAGDVATWLADLNLLRTNGTQEQGVDLSNIVADTLGVTGCGIELCGTDPGGNTIAMGQPPGGFSVPAGYQFVRADTTYPAPAGIQDYCYNNSWFEPCYDGDTMVVLVYAAPGNTQWAAGTGDVSGLAPLADPGNDSARVSLMFAERAYWLYVTGHRQGDLRRLIRQYSRVQSEVYPVGNYLGPGVGVYGSDVTAPIPYTETPNPFFHGCIDRNA